MKLSIRLKIAIGFLLVLIPIEGLAVSHYLGDLEDRRDLVYQNKLESAQILAIATETFVGSQVAILRANAEQISSNPESAPAIMARSRELDVAFGSVAYLDMDGQITSATPPGTDESEAIVPKGALDEVMSEGVIGVAVTNARQLPDRVGYNVIVPVVQGSAITGYVTAFIPDTALLEALDLKIGQEGNIGVIDRSGTALILSFKPELMWEDRDRTYVESIMTAINDGVPAINFGFDDPIDGGRRIGASAPVESLGWSANVFQPEDEAFAEHNIATRNELLALVGSGVIGIAIIWLASLFLVAPIEALARAARSVRDGDLSARASVNSGDELHLLAESFNSMAAKVEKSHNTEKKVADLMRKTLLPDSNEMADVDWLDIGVARGVAATDYGIGGDFYDVFHITDDRIGVVLGDVSGKGITAASHAASVRFAIRTLMMRGITPGSAFLSVNQDLNLSWDMGTDDASETTFVTVIAAVIDRGKRTLTIANAGHPDAHLCSIGGCQILSKHGTVLGALPDIEIAEETVEYSYGSTLIMVTDGVVEAKDATQEGAVLFGEERLAEEAHKYRACTIGVYAHALFDSVLDYTEGKLTDDTVVLGIKMKG